MAAKITWDWDVRRVVWKVRAKSKQEVFFEVAAVRSISWKKSHQVLTHLVYYFVFGVYLNRRRSNIVKTDEKSALCWLNITLWKSNSRRRLGDRKAWWALRSLRTFKQFKEWKYRLSVPTKGKYSIIGWEGQLHFIYIL